MSKKTEEFRIHICNGEIEFIKTNLTTGKMYKCAGEEYKAIEDLLTMDLCGKRFISPAALVNYCIMNDLILDQGSYYLAYGQLMDEAILCKICQEKQLPLKDVEANVAYMYGSRERYHCDIDMLMDHQLPVPVGANIPQYGLLKRVFDSDATYEEVLSKIRLKVYDNGD